MFIARGLAIAAAFFVASCSSPAAYKTYSVDQSEPAVRLPRPDRVHRPGNRIVAREHPTIDAERQQVQRLEPSPSASQTTTVRETIGDRIEPQGQGPIVPVSQARDPKLKRIVQTSKFLEDLTKDDVEYQLLKRKTIICRGC